MNPENEEKVAQPDLEKLPQPDTDPGVIDVDDDAIVVDGDGEEEDEDRGKNTILDDYGSTVDLVAPHSDAAGQKTVDVIDLEEADEEGDDEGDPQVEDEDAEVKVVDEEKALEEVGEESEENEGYKIDRDEGEEDDLVQRGDGIKDESGDEITPDESDERIDSAEQERLQGTFDNQKPSETQGITTTDDQHCESHPELAPDSEQTDQRIGEETGTDEISPLPTANTTDTEKSEPIESESQKAFSSVENLPMETTETGEALVQHQSSKIAVTKTSERAPLSLFPAIEVEPPQTTLDATKVATEEEASAAESDTKDKAAQVSASAPVKRQEGASLTAKESQNEGLDVGHPVLGTDMKPQHTSDANDSETEKTQEAPEDTATENEVDEVQESRSKSEGASDLEDGDDEDVVEENNMDMDAELTEDEPVQDEQPNPQDREPETDKSSKPIDGSVKDNQTAENHANNVDRSQVLVVEPKNSDAASSEERKDIAAKKDIGQPDTLSDKTADQPKATEMTSEARKTDVPGTEKELHGGVSVSEKGLLSSSRMEGKPSAPTTAGSLRDEGEAQKATDPNAKMDIDTPSKDMSFKGSANANLTAPLFGMQTMELPKGPVSFSSPPSFQRSRLSPSAPPFIPAAHRDAKRAATLQSTPEATASMDVSLSPTEEKPEKQPKTMLFPAFEGTAASESELQADTIGPPPSAPQPSIAQLPSAKVDEAGVTPQARPDQSDGVVSVKPDQKVPHEGPALPKTSKPVSVQPDASFASVSQPGGAPRTVASEGLPQTEKHSLKEESNKSQEKKVTFGTIETITVPKTDSQPSTLQPVQVSKSGGEPQVEEQELKEEETDDGSMYEVNHVPISVRIGNGTAIKRDSLSTLRLAVSKGGEAKLEMFKEGASSLLLFESLSSTRNTIRIRKVAKRTVMTVTLMTNNNGGAQIAKKYYVHLGKHIYDKIFNICVIHLNDAGPERRPGIESTPSSSSGKRPASSTGSDAEGTQSLAGKRSLEMADKKDPKRVKVAERRRQLLETKAKLLENLKAVRKNKAGTGVVDHHPTGKQLKRTAGTPIPSSALAKSNQFKASASMSGTLSTPAPLATTIQDTVGNSENLSESTKLKTALNKKGITKDETIVAGQPDKSIPISGQPFQAPPSSTRGKRPRPVQQLNRLQTGQNQSVEQESVTVKKMRVVEEKSHGSSVSNPNVQDKLKFLRDRARRGGRGGSAPTPLAGRRDAAEGNEVKKLRVLLNEKINSQTEAEKQKQEAMKEMASAKEETKAAKEDVKKTLEALSKATEEVTKTKSEVTKLLEQQREVEKALTAKTAENDLSLRQKNALTTEVSKLLKHVENMHTVENPLAHLKKESFSRCDHDSVSDFFDRLHSFKPSTWPVIEDSDIGARACARHGWYNSDVNVLRSTDGVELRLGGLYDDSDVHLDEVQRVKTALVEEHQFLSGWRGKQCARDIGKELLDLEALMKNVSEIQKHDVKKRVRGFSEGADRLSELTAACGWKPYGQAVRCEWCGIVVVGDLHLRESHYNFCMFAEEQDEVRRNIELLGLDWEVEGDRLGWFFRSSYGEAVDTVEESTLGQATKDDVGDVVMAG